MNFYSSFHVLGDLHQIDDALVALQRLEDHEQAKEYAFFCITEKLHESGTEGTELEVALPELLRTERERALYDALMETSWRLSKPSKTGSSTIKNRCMPEPRNSKH